jgi:hypothetical protein
MLCLYIHLSFLHADLFGILLDLHRERTVVALIALGQLLEL